MQGSIKTIRRAYKGKVSRTKSDRKYFDHFMIYKEDGDPSKLDDKYQPMDSDAISADANEIELDSFDELLLT